jgi:hypothetical protein
METSNPNSDSYSLKDERARARKSLDRLCQDGPPARPPETITLTHTDDLIQRNGRRHKGVSVRWNRPRRLTAIEMGILSFYREHSILVDGDGLCYGFIGREKDYHDYTFEARVRYE